MFEVFWCILETLSYFPESCKLRMAFTENSVSISTKSFFKGLAKVIFGWWKRSKWHLSGPLFVEEVTEWRTCQRIPCVSSRSKSGWRSRSSCDQRRQRRCDRKFCHNWCVECTKKCYIWKDCKKLANICPKCSQNVGCILAKKRSAPAQQLDPPAEPRSLLCSGALVAVVHAAAEAVVLAHPALGQAAERVLAPLFDLLWPDLICWWYFTSYFNANYIKCVMCREDYVWIWQTWSLPETLPEFGQHVTKLSQHVIKSPLFFFKSWSEVLAKTLSIFAQMLSLERW